MRKPLVAFMAIFLLAGMAAAGTTPAVSHIVVVAFENQGYSNVVGSASMPNLNALIQQGGLATNFFADAPGSIPDYFMLTTGEQVTEDASFTCLVSVNNLVRQLIASGKSWKSYAESIPSVGYLGEQSYPYVKWHNPFAYFSDVVNSSTQKGNIVGLSQWQSDVAGTLPAFSFIVPNQEHNAHDCPDGTQNCTNAVKLSTADQWLQSNVIGPLQSNASFQQSGLLVVWFDEGSDQTNGGGHIAIVFAGPLVNKGFQSATFYRHENLLRTIAEALRLAVVPGAALYVSNMAEFFGTATTGGTGAISGRITDISNGAGISGATVSFSGGSITTNSTGNYSFSSVIAGTYTVSAVASGYFKESNTGTVAAGATTTVNIQLPTGGKVQGTVTNSSGAVIAGATVKISGGSVATTVNTSTNTSGVYNSNWVPVGAYTVTVSASGHTTQSKTVNVTTGATATLNFTLQ